MIDKNVVKSVIDGMHLPDFSKATIREICTIANKVEALTGEKYVRMEMGVPGLAPDAIGTAAEIEALQKGVASKYPMLDGHPDLKKEASRFIKAFIDVDVNPALPSGYEVYIDGGRTATGADAVEWAKRAVDLGAGEIVVNSIDTDGVKQGFDLPMLEAVCSPLRMAL